MKPYWSQLGQFGPPALLPPKDQRSVITCQSKEQNFCSLTQLPTHW